MDADDAVRQPSRLYVGHCPECKRVVAVENDYGTWPLATCTCGWADGLTALVNAVRFEWDRLPELQEGLFRRATDYDGDPVDLDRDRGEPVNARPIARISPNCVPSATVEAAAAGIDGPWISNRWDGADLDIWGPEAPGSCPTSIGTLRLAHPDGPDDGVELYGLTPTGAELWSVRFDANTPPAVIAAAALEGQRALATRNA